MLRTNSRYGEIKRAPYSMYAWKKVHLNLHRPVLLKLRIPKGALVRVSPISYGKCRASRATPVSAHYLNGVKRKIGKSDKLEAGYNGYRYRIGKVARPQYPFDMRGDTMCGSGIHFYWKRSSAAGHVW